MSQALDVSLYPDLLNKPDRVTAMRQFLVPEVTAGLAGRPMTVFKDLKTTADLGAVDHTFADYPVDFIKRNAAQKKPSYLIYSFSRLHNDNYPAAGYAGKSPAGFPYKDAVVEVDDIVGRLIQILKETGQLENTFVFFTSDNGANEDVRPNAGYQPWRGGKGATWEGGVRIPGIAYWPGMIKPGRSSDGLLDQMDMYNTSLAVAGEARRTPRDRHIDGIDQSGLAVGHLRNMASTCGLLWRE